MTFSKIEPRIAKFVSSRGLSKHFKTLTEADLTIELQGEKT